MPMQRDLYPPNWDAIAHQIKANAGWCCEECGKPCRRPGEDWGKFQDSLPAQWADDFFESVKDEEFGTVEIERPGRFILTVAHLDHNPKNCDRANLRALCSVCHLRYDTQSGQMARKKMLKRERLGQLSLFR